jgi:hypothetical protein
MNRHPCLAKWLTGFVLISDNQVPTIFEPDTCHSVSKDSKPGAIPPLIHSADQSDGFNSTLQTLSDLISIPSSRFQTGIIICSV